MTDHVYVKPKVHVSVQLFSCFFFPYYSSFFFLHGLLRAQLELKPTFLKPSFLSEKGKLAWPVVLKGTESFKLLTISTDELTATASEVTKQKMLKLCRNRHLGVPLIIFFCAMCILIGK